MSGADVESEAVVRVIVVDDHEVLADALTQVLDAEPDIEVLGAAHDLAAARALLASTEVDVVLLDHRLPDLRGWPRSPSCTSCSRPPRSSS